MRFFLAVSSTHARGEKEKGELKKTGEGRQTQMLTFEYGTSFRPTISGTTNNVIAHPHTNNLNLKSCHSATNVNTPNVARRGLFDPPRGMYKYRTTQRL
jgi:hypothetical protein